MKSLSSLCIVLSLLGFACVAPVETAPTVGTVTQAVRAGVGSSGEVFLGADLLVTQVGGNAMPCDEASVQFSVSVSRDGEEGPYLPVENARVYRSCSSASQGRVALVMDNSSSLDGELSTLQEAAHRVAETIIGQGGQLSLTRVSTNASVLTPLTRDRSELNSGVDNMFISNGWTSLYDGIRMGHQTLGETIGDDTISFSDSEQFCHLGDRHSIIVFTDSAENNSAHQEHWSLNYPGDGMDTTLSDLAQLQLLGSTTPIYTVGLGDNADNTALSSLAQQTGGRHVSLDSPNDVKKVLSMLASYGADTHRVCTQLPDDICGSLNVRIEHRYNDGVDLVEGSSTQYIELPCPERAAGRLVTILLALDSADLGEQRVARLVKQAVNWVSPVEAPKVLVVRDDFHHEEHASTTAKLHELLRAAGYASELIDEPRKGLSLESVQGFDVIWFSNPGYPMDDLKTYNTLLQFSQNGGGVVMQGDDISRGHGSSFSMAPLTQLKHRNNGVTYCGAHINNGKGGRYEVDFPASEHPMLQGLAGGSFYYADDIDTTELIAPSAGATSEVLAWATTEGRDGCKRKPVIVAFTPAR